TRAEGLQPTAIGLQLYSLRNQFAQDVPGTLDLVRKMGVHTVELAGTYQDTPAQFKAALDQRGLTAVSGHFPFERWAADPEAVAQEAVTLGLKYAGCAWIPHNGDFDEKTCRAAVAVFNRAGAVLAKHGIQFFYHTHGYEFQPYHEGTLFDVLFQETDARLVRFEMDVFWIVHGGQDPVKWLGRSPERWLMLHVKGMRTGTEVGLLTGHTDVTNDVAVGIGRIDYVPVLRAARAAGVKYYIIEDESPSSVEQIPQSLKYLQNVTW
ncbi:MAG TPA: sugar phosphate isomerase/epimerase, partial [Verrucomicrobiae bacterium]